MGQEVFRMERGKMLYHCVVACFGVVLKLWTFLRRFSIMAEPKVYTTTALVVEPVLPFDEPMKSVKRSWYRTTLFNALVIGAVGFIAAGLCNAMNSVAAGGAQ